MPRSILLQLARDSIVEVLQAQRSIDKPTLIKEHPLLSQKIQTRVNLYLDNELRGSSHSSTPSLSLIEDIIRNAKKSAFEDANFSPISTNEYLSCKIEVILETPEGIMSEKDDPIIQEPSISVEKK